MYVLHYRRRHSKLAIAMSVLLLIGLGAGLFYSRRFLDTDTKIGPAPAAVYTTVADNRPTPKLFDETHYSLQLPNDWEKFAIPDMRTGGTSWRNTKDNKGVRVITVYVDAKLDDMAVNRVMPISVMSDHLILTGDVSDNCVEFTSKAPNVATVGAKWQGVDFVCDVANRFRNVVGIGAGGAPQGVLITGAATGKHLIYITYTDSSANFNSDIFSEMLKSFRVK